MAGGLGAVRELTWERSLEELGAGYADALSRTREGGRPYRGESSRIGHRANDPSVAAA
jgi:hypothetical protein